MTNDDPSMSEPAPKAKAKRRGLMIPWLLAILLVGGWSGYWFYSRSKVVDTLDAQAQALRDRGYDVHWNSRQVGGYPFRYEVRLADFRVNEPRGWGLTAPIVEAQASALWPNVVVLVAEDGFTVNRPDAPPLSMDGDVLRMSLGGLTKPGPWRVSMEGVKVALSTSDPETAAFSTIDRFEAHLRPTEGGDASVFLRVNEARPNVGNILSRISGGEPVTVGLEGRISHADALKGGGWTDWLTSWARAGGRLYAEKGGLIAGDGKLDLRPSEITADNQGFAYGDLKLTLARASNGVLALGEIGVLPEETAAVAAGATGAASVFSTDRDGFDVSFTFSDGRTFLGPLPLGPAPRLYRIAGSDPARAVTPAEPVTTQAP